MTPGDIHSPRHYLMQVVLPAYDELLRVISDGTIGGRRDTIALGHAAEACLHLADHVASDSSFNATVPGAPRSKKYIKHLAKEYPRFAITQDVANSWKHRQISDPDRVVDGISSLLERWALIRYIDSDGPYFATRKVILVRLTNGSEMFGEDLIEGCIKDWSTELMRLGIISGRPSLAHLARKKPRAELPERLRMKMRGVVGEYIESKPVILAYDEKQDIFLPYAGKIGAVEIDFTAVISPSPFQEPD